MKTKIDEPAVMNGSAAFKLAETALTTSTREVRTMKAEGTIKDACVLVARLLDEHSDECNNYWICRVDDYIEYTTNWYTYRGSQMGVESCMIAWANKIMRPVGRIVTA